MKKIENIIEQALKSEPAFKLGIDFKDRVLKTIRKKEKRVQRRLFILMALGVVIIMGFGVITLLYFQKLDSLKGLENIVPMAVMIGGVVAVIQYLDNKLVKKKLFTQQLQ
jgi:biotin transporter BioY